MTAITCWSRALRPKTWARAVNALADVGGGVVVVRAGAVTALVELPVGGLMSDQRAEVVAAKSARVMQAMRDCGCTLDNGYMQLSLLALVVIPELRISDLGLVDVSRFAHVPVIADHRGGLGGLGVEHLT